MHGKTFLSDDDAEESLMNRAIESGSNKPKYLYINSLIVSRWTKKNHKTSLMPQSLGNFNVQIDCIK